MTTRVLLQIAQEDLVTTLEDAGIGSYECGGMIGFDQLHCLSILSEHLDVAVHPDESVPNEAEGEIHGGPEGELTAYVQLRLMRREKTVACYEVIQCQSARE